MYLRALEIQGFKSFPDKTILTFDRDITAIVGPNGSGKSNISDAVRWVLGEQSTKQLRGTKMEDVIFGGTAKRSQSGYAEVSLILDNTHRDLDWDTQEVTITRRYYRSGEGEYFINRQSARLKDISELFMDTGLGRDGYSNIGQGRVDEILSQKSADRREIFEEAAGISKYRYRKQEAERRLSDTQDNLLRVEDKLSELELQVEPLRKQSEAAKRYLLLRDELRMLEVSVWIRDIGQLTQVADAARQDYAAAKKQLDDANQTLEDLYRQAETLSNQLHSQDEQLQTLRDRQQELHQTQAQTEQDWAVLHTNHTNNLQNIQRLEEQMAKQADQADSVCDQIQTRQDRLAELDRLDLQQAQEQADLEAQAETLNVQQEQARLALEELQLRLDQTKDLQSSLQADLSACTGSEQTLMDRETAVLREQSDVLLRLEQARKDNLQAQEQFSQAQNTLSQRENQLGGYTLRETARQNALEEKIRRLNQDGVELNTLQAKQRLLQEMQREYEGFNKAVRMILQERDRGSLSGIHGPVPELLKTRDDYTVAIETALGSSMQSIVVQSEAVGKQAIRLLKARNGGRATFLPLNVIQGRTLREKNLETCPGFLGLASDLVEYAPQYRGILENLLGRTVVADTLDHGVEIANRYDHRFRIVTLDGQLLNAGGSMTGGSASSSSGVLSRANELERLGAQVERLTQRQEQTRQTVQEAQKLLNETRRESAVAREALAAAQETLSDCKEKKARAELMVQTLEQALTAARQELEGLGGKLETGRDQAKGLEDQISILDRTRQDLELAVQAKTQDQRQLQASLDQIYGERTRLRVQTTARQAERQAGEQSLQELQALQTAMAGDKTRNEDLIRDYDRQNQDLAARMDALQQRTQDLIRQTAETQTASQELLTQRARTEQEKTTAERRQQEANREILLLERECGRLEQKQTAAQMEEKQLTDKLWDNYELTVSAASDLAQPVTSETSRRTAELRKQISSLGTPNLGAIEEYERVNERYTYLTTQRDDVLQAQGELMGIIQQITAEMTQIFDREFSRIGTAFAETFTELFDGGKASLELEDRDNILDCGIEIRVQPPGKQLKTLTLLSGGEKAFVAIALYFAILKVRPTPFCILDEIDAALDDRNVARYAAYMRSFTKDTQFIVITHRRGTMEASDVLYGVTMVEQGVSRMLTLDLSQVEEELHIKAE